MTAPDGSESDREYSFAQRQQPGADGSERAVCPLWTPTVCAHYNLKIFHFILSALFASKLYFNSLTSRCISCIIAYLTAGCNA